MADGTHPDMQEQYGSFLGLEPELQQPEESQEEVAPSGEEAEVAADAEAEPEAEPAEGQEAEAEVEQAEAEVADPELEKFLARKGISKEDFDDYAERYGLTAEQLKANPKLKFFVWDKINTDRELAKRSKGEEPAKQDQPAVRTNPADHVKQTLEAVQKFNDPEVLKAFATRFNEEQTPEGQFAVLSAAANNLIGTVVPQLVRAQFQQMVDEAFPGFSQQWNTWKDASQAEVAWQEMREREPKLPETFVELEKAALKKMPSLSKLPIAERLEAYAAFGAPAKSDPQQVAKAAEKGKQQGMAAAKTAALGKGLGVGKPKGQIGTKPAKEDPLADAIAEFTRNNDSFGGQRPGR